MTASRCPEESGIDSHVSLQLLKNGHAQTLYELTCDNHDHLRQWLPWLDSVSSVADTRKFIEATLDQYQRELGSQYAIFHNSDLCGVIGFHEVDRVNRTGSVGYWLARSMSGRGIMTAAVRTLLEIGFENHGLHRIEIRCAVDNLKSRAIPECLGLTFEGILRESAWLHSGFIDMAVYSILKTEVKV